MVDSEPSLAGKSKLTAPPSTKHRLRLWVQRPSSTVVLRIGGAGLSFLVTVVAARVLSLADFGMLSMLIAATNIGVVVALLGHETLATRTVAETAATADDDTLSAYRRTAAQGIFCIGLLAGLACAAAFLVTGRLTGPYGLVTVGAFAALLICIARTRYVQALLRGKGFVGLALVPDGIVRPALTIGIIVLSLPWLDGQLWVVAVEMAGAAVCASLLAATVESRLMGPPEPVSDVSAASIPRRFSAPIYLSSLLAVAVSQVAVLLVGHLGDSSQAALYGTAARVTMVAALVSQSLYLSISPHIARLHTLGDGASLAAVLRKYTRASTLATGVLTLILGILAQQIMGVFGPAYTHAVPALMVLLLSVLINAASGPTGMVLLMTKHESLHMVALAVSLLAQMVGCFVLIPPYGFVGAAYAVLASTVIWNGLMMLFIRNRLGLCPVLAWA